MPIHKPGRIGWASALALLFTVSASAQAPEPPIEGTTTKVEGLSLANTLTTAVRPVGPAHAGEALAAATQLAIGTAPFGVSTGGFLIKLDPNSGLQVRAASTFGPAFSERALTSGEGAVSVGVSYMYSKYTELGDRGMDGLLLQSTPGSTAAEARTGTSNLTITSNTIVIASRMGVTDKLDVGVNVPLVKVELGGSTSLADGTGRLLTFARVAGTSTGVGDIQGLVKYRIHSFGADLPDPGGLAIMASMRFPTGEKDNLRGLGVTRARGDFIYSSGTKKFRPHVNVGFEWWNKGVSIVSDAGPNEGSTARHQLQYAAGFEFEGTPKFTLLLDFLGGRIFGGGKVDVADVTLPAGPSQALVALPDGLTRLSLAPGAKINLKGKMLLSINALVALHDTGLHAPITPVAGLELTF